MNDECSLSDLDKGVFLCLVETGHEHFIMEDKSHDNIIYNANVHRKTRGSVHTDAAPAFDLLCARTC